MEVGFDPRAALGGEAHASTELAILSEQSEESSPERRRRPHLELTVASSGVVLHGRTLGVLIVLLCGSVVVAVWMPLYHPLSPHQEYVG